MAGTSLLSAASYCFSGVYRMSAKRDHTEPLVLDALTVAEPSFKKSPVMAMVKQPYIQFAHDWNEAHKQEIPVGHYKRGHDFTNLCAFVSGSANAGNGLRGKLHPQSKRQKGRINPCFPKIKDIQRTNRFSRKNKNGENTEFTVFSPLRFWQGQKESNPRHTDLESVALPAELYP